MDLSKATMQTVDISKAEMKVTVVPSPASDGYIPSNREELQLTHLFAAYQILKSEGWQDIIYCPKDGSEFWSISAGSTGIHSTTYDGEWPKGCWWISDNHDLWPARPILWKAKEI